MSQGAKMKVAELIVEGELLQQKQMIQNEAEKLRIKERLAKAKARIQAHKNIHMRSIRMDDATRVAKIEIEQEGGPAITNKEQNAHYRNT